MKTSRSRLLLIGASLLVPGALVAHHGTAGFYDKTKLVRLQGTVKEFRWRNPHSGLFLDVMDVAGRQSTYAIEGPSPASFSKVGFTKNTFKPGDKVEVVIWPAFGSATNGELEWRKGVSINGKALDINLKLAGE
jgi:hypothetical protein